MLDRIKFQRECLFPLSASAKRRPIDVIRWQIFRPSLNCRTFYHFERKLRAIDLWIKFETGENNYTLLLYTFYGFKLLLISIFIIGHLTCILSIEYFEIFSIKQFSNFNFVIVCYAGNYLFIIVTV